MADFGKFAIMDSIDVVITPLDSTDINIITIDYLNSSQLQLNAESQYARIKGTNAVSFSGGTTGTFSMNAEVLGLEYFALMLGGAFDSATNTISVGSVPVTKGYKIEGTFNVKMHATGAMKVLDIIMYNATPQVSADMTFDATAIGDYQLVMDVLANDAGKVLDMKPHVEAGN